MKETSLSSQPQRRIWVGLDWGGSSHAVSVVDDARTVLAQFTAGVTLEALEDLARRWAPWPGSLSRPRPIRW